MDDSTGAPDGSPGGVHEDERHDDRVDEMVEESFPASDPPAGWAGEDPRDALGPPESPDPLEGDGPADA